MPTVGGVAGDRLRSFIERIERIEATIRDEQEARKEVYAQAKDDGFDTKIMRQIVKERRMEKDDLDEQETLLDIYRKALAGWDSTPLGEAAMRAAAE